MPVATRGIVRRAQHASLATPDFEKLVFPFRANKVQLSREEPPARPMLFFGEFLTEPGYPAFSKLDLAHGQVATGSEKRPASSTLPGKLAVRRVLSLPIVEGISPLCWSANRSRCSI